MDHHMQDQKSIHLFEKYINTCVTIFQTSTPNLMTVTCPSSGSCSNILSLGNLWRISAHFVFYQWLNLVSDEAIPPRLPTSVSSQIFLMLYRPRGHCRSSPTSSHGNLSYCRSWDPASHFGTDSVVLSWCWTSLLPGANQKCVCKFLLVISSNFGCILYCF